MTYSIRHMKDASHQSHSFKDDVVRGLKRAPKKISPKHFYDKKGSELFDEICELPEYYPTRTEMGILRQHSKTIRQLVGENTCLLELGSGASKKVRLLLDEINPKSYVAMDISQEFLHYSTEQLAKDYPHISITAICADFSKHFDLPESVSVQNVLAFFPGSSIGNFEPKEAEQFLTFLRKKLGHGSALIIGVDLKKNPEVLHKAYNDSQGVTAEFNKNLLHRMRRELDTDIHPKNFEHKAIYNQQQGRIEMHLVSAKD